MCPPPQFSLLPESRHQALSQGPTLPMLREVSRDWRGVTGGSERDKSS